MSEQPTESIQVTLQDGGTISVSADGDIYQNLADLLCISRYQAKVILYKVLYGSSKEVIKNE